MTYRLKVLAARYLGYSQHLILLHTNTLSLDITNKKKKKMQNLCEKMSHSAGTRKSQGRQEKDGSVDKYVQRGRCRYQDWPPITGNILI